MTNQETIVVKVHQRFIRFSREPLTLRIVNAPSDRKSTYNRRNALKLIAAGALASLVDARWVEPEYLSVTKRDVHCKSLPPGLGGLRIAVLADFHHRPGQSDKLVEKVVARVNREKPDIIALAGDYINKQPSVIEPLLEQLKAMRANHGIFAVMGNHDGWAGDRVVIRRQFEKAGISFLINENSQLSIRGETLAVAGTDYVWLGKPDPERTLRGIAAGTPVLALVHEPDYFDTMATHPEVQLQVSGHTYGGQCRVPFIGYAPKVPKYGKKYIYGSYQNGSSNLFVSRGVGMTGPQMRFDCPPELAILTLLSPKA